MRGCITTPPCLCEGEAVATQSPLTCFYWRARMCNVCEATEALTRQGQPMKVSWSETQLSFELDVKGTQPEFTPAELRVRRVGGEWSPWVPTNDLAGSLGRLGTDVKWRCVPDPVKQWVSGKKGMEIILQLLSAEGG